MKIEFILIYISILVLGGCANAGPEFDPSKPKACCATDQSRPNAAFVSAEYEEIIPLDSLNSEGMVLIPSGSFYMGAKDNPLALPREFPKHQVQVDSFMMDATEVTNEQFAKFIGATGYVTVAERPVIWGEIKSQLPPGTPKPPEEDLLPGSLVFKKPTSQVDINNYTGWWEWQTGTNWQHPNGPNSDLKGLDQHPVVHVTYEDAMAYAKWCNKRLPTEAEWEWAASGGLENTIYPWGNEDVNEGVPKCNYWQGVFPYKNSLKDGFFATAPVKSFEPNKFGLFDMAGNVWEICADWYDENYYKKFELATDPNVKAASINPQGPSRSFHSDEPNAEHRVLKGGSFLCNDSYCASYRITARMPMEISSSLLHTGFRCVK